MPIRSVTAPALLAGQRPACALDLDQVALGDPDVLESLDAFLVMPGALLVDEYALEGRKWWRLPVF